VSAQPTPSHVSSLRALLAAGGIAAATIGACGITTRVLFAEPSQIKYAVTVVAPLVAVFATLATNPLRVLFGLALVTAPFTFVTTIRGVVLSPVLLLLGAALLVAALTLDAAGRRTATGPAAMAAVVLLAFPIALGSDPASRALWLGVLLAMGWLAYRLALEPGGLPIVLGLVVAAAAIQAALAVWSFSTGQQLDLYNASGQSALSPRDFFNFEHENRAQAAMPDPISLGNVLALACPLVVGLANETRSRIARIALACAGGLLALGLTLTYSRMSWIGAAVGVTVTVLLLPTRARLGSALAVACLLAIVVELGLAFGGSTLGDRFHSIIAPTSGTSTAAQDNELRLGFWRAAVDTAEVHPVFGTGYGKVVPELARHTGGVAPGGHAHSTYLQFLAEAGIAGALALALVLAGVARDLLHGLRRRLDAGGRVLGAAMAGSLACVLVVWLTDYNVRYTQVGAVIAALLGAAAAYGARARAPR
jgi:O-Antigen ligase